MPIAYEPVKIALVGVGPWGSLLARKFRGAGALVVCYSRQAGPDVQGLGQRVSTDSLWEPGLVDGIVIAAPPAVTLELAQMAAVEGKAVLATKPLQLTAPLKISAPFLVDYVRLWAKGYQQLRTLVAGHAIARIEVEFYGSGPFRAFSSLDDYGPQALAFVHDLLGTEQPLSEIQASPVRRFHSGATLHGAQGRLGNTTIKLQVGNGAPARRMSLLVVTERGSKVVYEEAGPNGILSVDGEVMLNEAQDPLTDMATQLIHDTQGGVVNDRFMHLSVAVTHSLTHIHQAET
jgi:hypothetical protein